MTIYKMPEVGAEDFNLGSCNHYYKQESREEDVECAICLCKIDDDDEIRELRCDHLFHKVCLDRWIGCRRSTCPICRSSLIPRRLVAGMDVIFSIIVLLMILATARPGGCVKNI